MLIALLTALLIATSGSGSGTTALERSFARARDAVEAHVTDDERREKLLDTVDEAESAVHAYREEAQGVVEDCLRLGESHESTSDDVMTVLAPFREKTSDHQDRMIALRFKLRNHMTREEWAAVFPAPAPEGE